MTSFWNTFGPWIISAVGGAIGALLLLPSKLGEILFKYRFDKEIEGFKADQGAKLERLREQLNHLGDRGGAPTKWSLRRYGKSGKRSWKLMWQLTIALRISFSIPI
jgi:hypothetical protein